MNIKSKLIVNFVLIGVSVVIVLSLLSNQYNRAIFEDQVVETLESIADQKSEKIVDYLTAKKQVVQLLSNMPKVEEALVDFNIAFAKGVNSETYLQQDQRYRRSLIQVKRIANAYDLFLINTSGDIIFSVLQEQDFATNLTTGEYSGTLLANAFNEASKNKKLTVTEFTPYQPSQWLINQNQDQSSTGLEAQSAFISAPVLNKGELLGVVAIQLNSDDYFSLSKDYLGLKNTGEIIISKVENGVAKVISPLRNKENAEFNLTFDLASSLGQIVELAVSGEEGQGHINNYNNIEVIAAWRHIPELNWGIVVTLNANEAFEGVKKIQRQTLYVGVVVILFCIVFASYLSRSLSGPIVKLANASREAGAGNLDVNLDLERNDELGVLAHEFKQMLSSRKNYEQNILEHQNKLQRTLSEIEQLKYALDQHSIVAITNVAGDITYANEKFEKISGYSKEELIGSNHRIVNSGFHSQDFFKNMYHTISKGKVWSGEIRNKSKSKKLYWVESTIVPFLDNNGHVESYIVIRTDITERKDAEAKLIKAKVAADMAVIAKSEFLASMSHEIRTPMNGVLGMLGLLAKAPIEAEYKRKVDVAYGSAKSLLSLINDILDYSKIEAGKLDLEILDFDLRALLGDFIDSMAMRAQEKDIELILDFREIDYLMVRGDPSRIRQILANLVGNAIKFTHRGQIIVRASFKDSEDGEYVFKCEIVDSGIGIAQDKIEALFESFTQADSSTTREYGGTGLGLAIVKRLCEIQNGGIEATSKLGEGSTFSFWLKMQCSEQKAPVVPQIDIAKFKLLVVDDNLVNVEVLSDQLRIWGANVEYATSGSTALELMKNQHYDLAFLDYQMPKMSGPELAEKMNEQFPNIKKIMMTSMISIGESDQFKALKFNGYFPKPATAVDLMNALKIIMDAKVDIPIVNHDYLISAQKEEVDLSDKSGKRILLVEDNFVNQEVSKAYIEQYNMEVVIAEDGIEAINALLNCDKDKPFDLIFMDCQMPNKDGFEATKDIRHSKGGISYKGVNIIAMTANAMTGDRERCIDCGMDDYMVKPFEPIVLEKMLQKWL